MLAKKGIRGERIKAVSIYLPHLDFLWQPRESIRKLMRPLSSQCQDTVTSLGPLITHSNLLERGVGGQTLTHKRIKNNETPGTNLKICKSLLQNFLKRDWKVREEEHPHLWEHTRCFCTRSLNSWSWALGWSTWDVLSSPPSFSVFSQESSSTPLRFAFLVCKMWVKLLGDLW